MTKHEIFARFFTDLLQLDNRLEAVEIAKKAWPATSSMWLHLMDIDPVLIELGVAKTMGDGRTGYMYFVDETGSQYVWEIERPTPEQERQLREMAEEMLRNQTEAQALLISAWKGAR